MNAGARDRRQRSPSLQDLVSRALGIPREQITRDARFDEDLDVDALDRLELFDWLERGCGIRLPDDAAGDLETVADLEALVLRAGSRG